MRFVQRRGEIGLQGIRAVAAAHCRSDAVEYQIADRIGPEVHAGVALADRELVIDVSYVTLQAEDAEACDFALTFVQLRRIEVGDVAVNECRLLIRIVRDLEAV